MNGMVINKLIALDRLDLRKNPCINRWLRAENDFAEFINYASNVINANCHFNESDPEKLTREVDTESLISEYSNSDDILSEKLTGGVELRNYNKIVTTLAILVNLLIFSLYKINILKNP